MASIANRMRRKHKGVKWIDSSFAKNSEAAKDPRYTIEIAFDDAFTILKYFTSQTINPDQAVSSIGSISFNLADKTKDGTGNSVQ